MRMLRHRKRCAHSSDCCPLQAAKVHAATMQRQARGALSGGCMDAMQLGDVMPLLERSIRVAASVQEAFQQGADVTFEGWQALCASQAGDARRWAILRLDCSKVKGQHLEVPPSLHLVALQVRSVTPVRAVVNLRAVRMWQRVHE